jgi:hypothetical protein
MAQRPLLDLVGAWVQYTGCEVSFEFHALATQCREKHKSNMTR